MQQSYLYRLYFPSPTPGGEIPLAIKAATTRP